MSNTIPASDLIVMWRAAVARIRANVDLLTKLDSVTGDGDHGTAMLRSMEAIEKAIDEHSEAGVKELLSKAGWGVMSAAGGSTGPLLGSFLVGMGTGLGACAELDGPALSAVICGGIGQMHKHSKAQVGDKTMMDALLPAAEVLQANEASAAPGELMKLAAEAAAEGAERTKGMLAKFGRARNLGERVLGHADPGATSMSLILAGFAEAL
jgi:phosphoenolpyruvate---glycerone phosphotransferase subunit DhaL